MTDTNDLPTAFSAPDAAEIGRMLRVWRDGHLNPSPDEKLRAAEGDGEPFVIEITEPAAGPGKYVVTLVQTGTDAVATDSPLLATDLGTVFTPEDASLRMIGLNLSEVD